MSSSTDTILGIVLMARHGDREGFYQDPTTYTATQTSITPLGEVSSSLPECPLISWKLEYVLMMITAATRVCIGLFDSFALFGHRFCDVYSRDKSFDCVA